MREPVNEACASALMKEIGIFHIPFFLSFSNERTSCVRDCFASATRELMRAYAIANHFSKVSEKMEAPLFDLMKNGCEEPGVPGFQSFINELLAVDFIIKSEDRHLFNF